MLDQRHTFVGSIVATPQFDKDGATGALLNDNVFGIAMQFASGIPVNLRSNRELNNDGTSSDRPSGVARNSLELPARYNVDFRYSRRFRVHGDGRRGGDRRGDEPLQHCSDRRASTRTIATDTLGDPLAPLPTSADQLQPTGGYEQRQLQIGFRVSF